jgi:hypothetical protein
MSFILKNLDKSIFVNKYWPNDAKIGWKSPSSLLDVIEIDFNLEEEFEGAFERDKVVELKIWINLFYKFLYIFSNFEVKNIIVNNKQNWLIIKLNFNLWKMWEVGCANWIWKPTVIIIYARSGLFENWVNVGNLIQYIVQGCYLSVLVGS